MSKAAELAKWGEVSTNGQVSGRRNIVINGAMKVAQRSTSVADIGAASGYFTLDRFNLDTANSAGRLTMTQTADGPSGFANCLKLDCTTADTSIAAGESTNLQYRIEGQDLQQFKKGTADAEKMTISFYVKGNGNATYVLELYDGDNSRQISKSFSVTSSWTRVSLTYDGDTTGAFDDDNALSLYLVIWLHAGSTFTGGTLNTAWNNATTANRAAGIDSFFSSTDNNFFITGVQLEVGSVATPFEHRSFGEELALCQRYYQQIVGVADQTIIGSGRANGTSIAEVPVPLAVSLRASPTMGSLAFAVFGTSGSGATATSAPTVRKFTPEGAVLHLGFTGSGLVNGQTATVATSSASTLTIKSEL